MIKGILFSSAIFLGAWLGMAFNVNKKIANWRFYLSGALFIFAIFLAFFTPVSITTRSFDRIAVNPSLQSVHLKIDEDFQMNFSKISENVYISKDSNKIDFSGLMPSNSENYLITKIEKKTYRAVKAFTPFGLALPYIPTLEERSKILFFHAPAAWLTALGYLLSMAASIMYLRKKDLKYDYYAYRSAELGFWFSAIANFSGMIWAKSTWGSYWNWDPRETTFFILIIIYLAYFGLRFQIDDEQKRARLSAVYSIFAFISVPFLVFILPRALSGLHPGAEGSMSPLLSYSSDSIDFAHQIIFALSFLCITSFYFLALNLSYRFQLVEQKFLGHNE